MPDIAELATRLAVIKALRDQVNAADDATRAELEPLMDEGDRKSAKLDGHPIGSVTMTKPSVAMRESDRDAFYAWVERHAPFSLLVTETIDPSWTARVVEEVRESIPEAVVTTRHVDQKWLTAWAAGLVLTPDGCVDPSTGEVVPGIVARQTVRAHLTVTQSTDERHAVIDAYRSGRLDLAGAVVPQIEASDGA